MDLTADSGIAGLIEAAAAVAGELDLHGVLKTTATAARETTGARYAALGVIGENGTLVDFVTSGISSEESTAIGHPPIGAGVLGELIRNPQMLRLDRVADHPASTGVPTHHPEMTSFLGAPIQVGRRVFGNLYLAEKDGGFTEEDEATVRALAAIAGGAVTSARLHERVTRLAVIEDRERIARDLHDAVIQDLFAVGLSLQALVMTSTDEGLVAKLDDAADRIDGAISSLRSFIFDLRSLASAVANPEMTLKRMVGRLTAQRDLEVHFNVDIRLTPRAEALDDALFIIREAVSNAIRHGSPSTIDVGLSSRTDGLRAEVRDNGSGFDPDNSPRGMGIENMLSRAELADGTLSIDSAPGKGTTVALDLPVSSGRGTDLGF